MSLEQYDWFAPHVGPMVRCGDRRYVAARVDIWDTLTFVSTVSAYLLPALGEPGHVRHEG